MKNIIELVRSILGRRTNEQPGEVKLPMPPKRMPRFGMARYEDIASDFIDKILEMDYKQVYISSMSSLWDFYEEPETYVQRVQEVYGVDINDIKDGNLVAIFKRLQKELKDKSV